MPLPSSFLAHLRTAPYHPRSDKHSNALAEAIVTDLLASCPDMARAAGNGELVWDLNFDLVYGTATWNVDLVIGAPPLGSSPPLGEPIRKTAPSSVHIAAEIKGIMTEHRKAVKNRKRDLESHHGHVHDYNNETIAAGVLVLNVADEFMSPLRKPGDITKHKDPVALIEHCMKEASAIATRGDTKGDGLDAKTVIVVDADNMDFAGTTYFEAPPAPKVGNPMHYDAFIQRICATWRQRFKP